MKSGFLFLFSQAPHRNWNIPECLDMTLTAAAFDQSVDIVLIDDGVYILKAGQKPGMTGLKNVVPIFDSLSIYDVEPIYVEEESLRARGLSPESLALPVQLISGTDLRDKMERRKILVNF